MFFRKKKNIISVLKEKEGIIVENVKSLKSNVGGLDRMARFVVGIVLVILAALQVISPWGGLGILLIGSAVFKFCPSYYLFGYSTCKKNWSSYIRQ